MINHLLEKPFAFSKSDKEEILLNIQKELLVHHAQHCSEYANFIRPFNLNKIESLDDIPFLPVQIFKKLALKSITDQDVFRVLSSSGTTGQTPSRVFLDRDSAALQSSALVAIVTDFIGKSRLPMLIIDSPDVVKSGQFSARTAAILGFSYFGRGQTYALNSNMDLNINAIETFLEKYQGQKILLFGFTFIIWQYLLKAAIEKDCRFDMSQAYIIHGGGWKKLQNLHIKKEEFKKALQQHFGIRHVIDYYGMVEQIGSVFMECEQGYLHTPAFADVIIRDPQSFAIQKNKTVGLIQTISALPRSYPGHSLLTEDLGQIMGQDNCPCGRTGKYFAVIGRIKAAEVRGCSDTIRS